MISNSTIYVSPQIKTLLGYTPDEWLADPKLWSKSLHPDDRQHVLKRTGHTDQVNEPFNMEYRMIARDGHVVWVHDQVTLVHDLKGQPTYWQGIMLDITESKQAEETIRQYSNELERRVEERTTELVRVNNELIYTQRAKDEFFANMSHELRTPLNSILGLSESMLEQKRGPLNEKQEQYIKIIESNGRHLLDVINDILEVSKVEAGKLELHPDIVSVKDLCESSLNFIRELAVRKAVSIDFRNEQQISTLQADPQRLKQILVNLLSNAVKFTPANGAVALEVHLNPEKDQISFSVKDSGIGIAHEELPKLFTPFMQVDSSLSRQYEGTGLGLVLVLKLTELHGGSVRVESEINVGSCFTITLPWSEQTPEARKEPSKPTSSVKAIQEHVGSSLSWGKILLAEDTESNVLTISDYLMGCGYEVVVAHDGVEAIDNGRGIIAGDYPDGYSDAQNGWAGSHSPPPHCAEVCLCSDYCTHRPGHARRP